jgi:hypothetical protein
MLCETLYVRNFMLSSPCIFNKSQITQQRNALYFHFLFFNLYICFSLYKAFTSPPEDGLAKAETYVGVKE